MTREEAIFVLECVEAHGLADDAKKMAIEALKAEQKHAYVIVDEDGNMECSNCGSSNCFDNYCGNCGAKLIGEREDEVEE